MKAKKNNVKKEVFEWVKSIALAIIIAIIIKTFVFDTTYVLGYSMYPTLNEKDRLFTNKIIYLLDEPERGDVVILDAPDDPDKDYIKRVIGIEGDIVEIKEGAVYLNQDKIDEGYIENGIDTLNELKIEVPKNEVFLLGDNRNEGSSKDSRYFGTVNIDNVHGKAFFRYFPFNDKFGTLK